MNFLPAYFNQVELLLQVLPIINEQTCFALKGGTAINLFVRDMPRLSVDIDLAYLPIEPREKFLKNITLALQALASTIKDKNLQIKEVYTKETKQLAKLLVHDKETMIKIEPNLVLRGSVFECETRSLCQRAQDQFLQFTSVKTLSFADLYGGKICAALSRQHPRDLFDIKILLENEGFTEEVKQAFLVYLVSNSRPMSELLDPSSNQDDFFQSFESSFSGMTQTYITFEELFETRTELIRKILHSITNNERQFLLSIKAGEPDWSLLPISGLEKFPAMEWKLINIRKMDKQKRTLALAKLKKILEILLLFILSTSEFLPLSNVVVPCDGYNVI